MMMIALVAILALWLGVAAALAAAGSGRHRTEVAIQTALASTEPIRANQAASDEDEAWHRAASVA